VSFATPQGDESYELESDRRGLVLDAEGLHHPGTPRGRRAFTPYADVTHIAGSRRTVWIGTRKTVLIFSRRLFTNPADADELVRSLLSHIAAGPGGPEQLARMAQIEQAADFQPPLRAVWGLALACVAVFLLQLGVGPSIHEAGYLSPPLLEDGDLWRLLTANLIHGFPSFPIHMMMNLVGVFALGFLVERPLGTARTVCVMGASGVGAMGASWLAGYSEVVGSSGVVFGLAGAVLWLELRCASELPAWWRIPRPLLYTVLLVNIPLSLLPFIAGAAHAGGLAAGLFVTALMTGRHLPSPVPSPGVRLAAAGVLVLVLLSGASAGRELASGEEFLARHNARLAELPYVSVAELNMRAWVIATSEDPTPAQLDAALRLAERAAVDSGRSVPEVLDTLAEVQFQLGFDSAAIATIDEAIALAPEDSYYREQRRRFLGERGSDDRPADPLPWWLSQRADA
jgi:membrane associated rhomboid family serine protease